MQLQNPVPGSRFIDPAVLAKIGNLEFVARSVVDGVINGSHRSPYFGVVGGLCGTSRLRARRRHPARRLARVCAEPTSTTSRNSRPTRTPTSASCSTCRSRWRSATRITKLDYAKTLSACLTYLVSKQRDRVGLVTFDEDILDHVPPSAKHVDVVLHTLDRVQAKRPGRLGAADSQAGRALRPSRDRGRGLGLLRRARRGARCRRA